MNVEFHPGAQSDLLNAFEWYERQDPGLGEAFAAEVDRVIATLIQFPEASQKITRRARQCPTRRFPYGVVYQALPGRIRVLAISHLRRDQKYWSKREKEA